jgi:hypothetical protein
MVSSLLSWRIIAALISLENGLLSTLLENNRLSNLPGEWSPLYSPGE